MERVDTSDAELLEASRRGDRAAFGAIIGRYQRAVGAVSYSGTRDRALSDDVAQDTFVTAWCRLGALRDPHRLSAWLCGIARNLARAAQRRRRREIAIGERDPAIDATPYHAIAERETEAAVAKALARVPDKYREPLVLFYGEQLSVKEVASVLGITEQATHQRMSRGRHCLADHLGLVENTLSQHRARRDLVAGVLAAIAVLRSPHAIASGGKIMWKLGFGAALLAAITATGYTIQSSSADPARTAVTTTSTPAVGSAGAARPSPSPSGVPHRAPAVPALPKSGASGARPGGSAGTGLDCHAAARRMGELMFEAEPDALHAPAEVREHEITDASDHLEPHCIAGHWSAAQIACAVGANDLPSILGCNIPRDPPLPGDSQIATSTVAPASLDDRSCHAVGVHLAAIARPDPAALAALPSDKRASIEAGLARANVAMPERVEASCEQNAWTEPQRTCLLQSTTEEELRRCFRDR
jgi:RNA polymerase sigma factor (sigma-70 family)